MSGRFWAGFASESGSRTKAPVFRVYAILLTDPARAGAILGGGKKAVERLHGSRGESAMPVHEHKRGPCRKKISLKMTVSTMEKNKRRFPRCGSRKVEKPITGFSAVTSNKS